MGTGNSKKLFPFFFVSSSYSVHISLMGRRRVLGPTCFILKQKKQTRSGKIASLHVVQYFMLCLRLAYIEWFGVYDCDN